MSEQEILRCENIGVCYHIGGMRFHGLRSYLLERTHGKGANVLWANRKISFGLERGDMLGILGKNGAGKSTLLKAIAGILAPAEGAITVNGSIAALLELTSGFDQDMTVRDNIYLRGAMLGCSAAFLKERYDKILAFAELTRFEDYAFYTLSSGMKSRLAFAIATLVDADILILDEIFAVGDGAFRKKSEAKILSMLENDDGHAGLSHHRADPPSVQQGALAGCGAPDRLLGQRRDGLQRIRGIPAQQRPSRRRLFSFPPGRSLSGAHTKGTVRGGSAGASGDRNAPVSGGDRRRLARSLI